MIEVDEFLSTIRTFDIRKEARFDDSLIDDFIRGEKCGICGVHPPSTVSHVFGKGRAGKNASSIFKMPKCIPCHRDWEYLSLEEFERKHAVHMKSLIVLWAEKIAAYLCNKIRELTGEEKIEPKKVKVKQPKKQDSIFKKARDPRNPMEKCKTCLFKSLPTDEVRHFESCSLLHSLTS